MRAKASVATCLLSALVLAGIACGDDPQRSPDAPQAPELPTPAASETPDVVLEIDGVGEVPMLLNPDDRVVTSLIRKHGIWEPHETYWFVRSIREGDVVVDVGANVGYYTLLAGHLVGESGRVFAFEPEPETFSWLERNVRLNGLDNVVLEQKAASNEAGSLRLYLSEGNRGDHRIFQLDGENRAFVEVEAVALDDYFGDRAGDVDFVKIDTQGAEMVILQGMQRILEESEDLVLAIEYWPEGLAEFGVEPLSLIDLLTAHDFRFFDLNRPARKIAEVDRETLRKTYRVRNKLFTNLLTVHSRVAALGPEAPGFPRPPARAQRPQPGG